MTTPEIRTLPEKKLVGQRLNMSMANNLTSELWRNFMPRQGDIQNRIGGELYSMQLLDPSYFTNFNPQTTFEKWAAVEVTDFENVPVDMETFLLPSGTYAVFQYKGAPGAAAPFFQYIFGSWLPASEYILDNRPHFEILGKNYKNESADSEEEVWIPVRRKDH